MMHQKTLLHMAEGRAGQLQPEKGMLGPAWKPLLLTASTSSVFMRSLVSRGNSCQPTSGLRLNTQRLVWQWCSSNGMVQQW
jgi:hypothetical protein